MSGRIRPWWYGLGLIGILVALAVLPSYFRKSHFLYTASESTPKEAMRFDLDRPFARLNRTALGEKTTLRKLMQDHPAGVLINFWATWCPPCLDELPSLEQLHRQLEAKKDPKLPALVTISVDERPREVWELYKTLSFQPTFDVLYDPEGEYAQSLGTNKFPDTFWVGTDGTVRYKWLGPQDWASDAVLRRLASE